MVKRGKLLLVLLIIVLFFVSFEGVFAVEFNLYIPKYTVFETIQNFGQVGREYFPFNPGGFEWGYCWTRSGKKAYDVPALQTFNHRFIPFGKDILIDYLKFSNYRYFGNALCGWSFPYPKSYYGYLIEGKNEWVGYTMSADWIGAGTGRFPNWDIIYKHREGQTDYAQPVHSRDNFKTEGIKLRSCMGSSSHCYGSKISVHVGGWDVNDKFVVKRSVSFFDGEKDLGSLKSFGAVGESFVKKMVYADSGVYAFIKGENVFACIDEDNNKICDSKELGECSASIVSSDCVSKGIDDTRKVCVQQGDNVGWVSVASEEENSFKDLRCGGESFSVIFAKGFYGKSLFSCNKPKKAWFIDDIERMFDVKGHSFGCSNVNEIVECSDGEDSVIKNFGGKILKVGERVDLRFQGDRVCASDGKFYYKINYIDDVNIRKNTCTGAGLNWLGDNSKLCCTGGETFDGDDGFGGCWRGRFINQLSNEKVEDLDRDDDLVLNNLDRCDDSKAGEFVYSKGNCVGCSRDACTGAVFDSAVIKLGVVSEGNACETDNDCKDVGMFCEKKGDAKKCVQVSDFKKSGGFLNVVNYKGKFYSCNKNVLIPDSSYKLETKSTCSILPDYKSPTPTTPPTRHHWSCTTSNEWRDVSEERNTLFKVPGEAEGGWNVLKLNPLANEYGCCAENECWDGAGNCMKEGDIKKISYDDFNKIFVCKAK